MTSPHEIYVDQDGNAVQVSRLVTLVEFHTEGGGPVELMREGTFLELFKLRTDPPAFEPVIVTGEWDYDTKFPAYSNGVRWNGWVVPYFTKDTALAVMAANPDVRFHADSDSFISPQFGDEPIVAVGVDIAVDGQFIHVYNLFDGWTWELAEVQP